MFLGTWQCGSHRKLFRGDGLGSGSMGVIGPKAALFHRFPFPFTGASHVQRVASTPQQSLSCVVYVESPMVVKFTWCVGRPDGAYLPLSKAWLPSAQLIAHVV